MCSLLSLLTFSLQLVASYTVSAFHLCLPLLYSDICSLTETMPWKFEGSGEISFGGSEKDCYFSKILKLQHKLVREYKREKLVPCFLNNAAKHVYMG